MTTETETAIEVCKHHWKIESGISPQVGRCKNCGESRIFRTGFDEALRTNAKGKPANQAGTPVRGMAYAGFVTPWEPGLLR